MQLQKIGTAEAVSRLFSGYIGLGFVGLGVRQNGSLGVKKWLNTRNVEEYFSSFHQHETTDLYITSNIFKNGFRDVAHHRREENLLSCVNIVIDVDCHDSDTDTKSATILLKSYVCDVNDAIENGFLLPYHMAVFTGRGVQFWYTLKSAAAVCKFLFDTAAKELISRYEIIRQQNNNMFKCYLYDALTVDISASGRAVGLFRLPGTINTLTASKGEIELNPRYNYQTINDFLSLLGITIQKNRRKHTKYSLKRKVVNSSWLHLQERRKAILELLQVSYGKRDIFCFLYYNSLVQLFDRRKARKYLEKYNDELTAPLRNSQIYSIIKAVDHVGYYKFTQDKFYEFAQISDEERKAVLMKYNIQKQKPPSIRERERKYAKNRALKAKRDDRIRELALQGKTYTEIQNILHVARHTIARILASNKEIDAHSIKKENQMQRITSLLLEGKTRKEIASIMEISNSTLARRIAEMKKKGMV